MGGKVALRPQEFQTRPLHAGAKGYRLTQSQASSGGLGALSPPLSVGNSGLQSLQGHHRAQSFPGDPGWRRTRTPLGSAL